MAAKKDAYTAVRTAIVFTGETRRCSRLGEASGLPSPKGFDGPGSRRLMSAAVVLLCAACAGELSVGLHAHNSLLQILSAIPKG